MQGILCLLLVAACFELSTARPRLKTVGVMASVWPRSGPHQAGFSAILVHPKAGHPSPSKPSPPPCSLKLRCPEGMNPPMGAAPPTREAREFPNPLARKSRQDHQIPLNMSKNSNMLTRWREGSPRAKRSVAQGTAVQYTGFKDVKFRMQGPFALYLMPTPSGNSLRLSTQHANHTCFRVHMFEESATNRAGGLLVMVQAHTGNYLQATTSTSLSLVNNEVGVATVTQVDNRFFRLTSYIGDNSVRIKHIITNLHLQARLNGVSLVNTDPLAAEGMHFYEYNCSTI